MMRTVLLRALAFAATSATLFGNWPTFGGDAQRSGWAREETEISRDNVKQLHPLWTVKLDNEPRELNNLTSPVAVSPVYTDAGVKNLVVVGGSSDNIYVVDGDTGKVMWHKQFTNSAPPPSGPQSHGSYFCPNALNDTPAVTHTDAGYNVYVISIDGKLHGLNLLNGEDRFEPRPFVPAYSKNWSLNVVDQVVYTSTSQGCAQAKSAVWAMDLSNPASPVTQFVANPYGAGIWGRGGVSLANDGTVYAATGDGPVDPAGKKFSDTVLALAPKTLALADYYMPANANYLTRKDLDLGNSTPVAFNYKDHPYLVTGGKEGVLVLLDGKSLGGETHRKPLYQTPLLVNAEADIAGRGFWGAFASYQDEAGTRWVFAPAWGATAAASSPAFPKNNGPTPNGSIMAFRIADQNGAPTLQPAWISHDISVPEPPVIANGLVFSLGSGEDTRQIAPDGHTFSAKERRERTKGHAVLYGFDAATGQELYSSGPLTSFTHFGGIAVSAGRIFVTLNDGSLICFGPPE